jgi:hypothetical protein
VRTATTFGPAFAERALTSGEGRVSIGVNFTYASYDRLGDLPVDALQLGSAKSSNPRVARTGITSLVLTSKTLVLSGAVGVTDSLDVGVAVPMVSVKLDGISSVQNGNGDVLLTAKGGGISSGLGDIAALAKYRLVSFGEGQPDPGGLSVVGTLRMPTGDAENFRGLGVTRALIALVASSGKGRIRPHVNGGYEWWNKGIDVVTDFNGRSTVSTRNQLQYAAGVELEATPKLTVMVDFLGRNILGGGRVGFRTQTPADTSFGVTSFESAVALSEGIRKLTLVPGFKLNLKGNLLLSVNGLMALSDTGLHARFTPVVGLELTP